MEEKEISEKIIGCAYKVYNKMGFGFLESVYEKCMAIEMKKASLSYEIQKLVSVMYDNEVVGDFKLDMLVENKFIVELKVATVISQKHEVQLVNYLKATGIPLGLLINFGEEGVEIRRKYRDRKAVFE